MKNEKRKMAAVPGPELEEPWVPVLAALREWNEDLVRAAIRLREKLAVVKTGVSPARAVAISPDSRRERLRQWRREEARKRGVAPYFVLTNGVVEKLAVMEVVGREDLRRVPGIGPRKMEVYGEAILRVLGG